MENRYFEARKNKSSTIDDLVSRGEIGEIRAPNTEDSICVMTDGCTPTVAELGAFLKGWLCPGERIWYLRELSVSDAESLALQRSKLFSRDDQKDYGSIRFYAIFLKDDDLYPIVYASGLSFEEMRDSIAAIQVPGCLKFAMGERGFYDAKDKDLFELSCFERAGGLYMRNKCIGSLTDMIERIKDYPVDESKGEFHEISPKLYYHPGDDVTREQRWKLIDP